VTKQRVSLPGVALEIPQSWGLASAALVAPRTAEKTLLSGKPAPSYRTNLVVQMEARQSASLEGLAEAARAAMERSAPDYVLLNDEAVEVCEREGLLREQSFTDASGLQLHQYELFVLIDEHKVLHALATAAAGDPFARDRAELRATLLDIVLP
jgi:hypothetical protein